MKTRRLAGIAALSVAAASVLAIPGAGAQQAGYAASADGQALGLSVFGEGLTLGHVHSDVDSTPAAHADGAGVLNPVAPVGASSASAEADGATDGSTDETCEGELPEIPGLALALACSASVAAVTDGNPGSAASARVGQLAVNPVGALLDTPLADVVDQVEDGVGGLLDGLAPVLGPVDDATGLGLEDTVGELLQTVLDGAPLATLTLGPTQTRTASDGTTVTSTCAATGARLDLLDAPPVAGAVDPPPVISVIVGDASTSATADLAEGTSDADVNPALVRVIAPSLGIDQPVEVGDPIEIPLPEPLGTSVITVGGGSTGTDGDGNAFARASAVSLDLLNGEALMGGIELALADCQSVAGANATSPDTAPPTEAPQESPPPLPRTGGTTPDGLAIATAVAFAGLGLVLLRRSSVS